MTRFEKLRIIINRMDATTSYSVAKSTLLYYMYILQDYTILNVIVLATVYCVLNVLNPLRFVHLYYIYP